MTSDLIPQVNTTLRLTKTNTRNSYDTQYGAITPDPIRVKALVPDDFLLYKGRPTVPLAWCRSRALATIDGTAVSDQRPVQSQLGDLEAKMFARFYAAPSYYDTVTGTWTPSSSRGVQYYFTSPPGMSPSLEGIDYTKQHEIIRPNCLLFSYADYLSAHFTNSAQVATAGFTMYLVGLVQGTDTGCLLAFDNGFEIAHNSAVFLTTDQRSYDYFPGGMSIQQMTPFYLVLSVNQQQVKVFLSSGTGNLYSKTTYVADPTWNFNFMIGKSFGKNPGYAQISLMDFGIFDYPMDMPVSQRISHQVVLPPEITPLSPPRTLEDPNRSTGPVVIPPEITPIGQTTLPDEEDELSTPSDHLDVTTLISSLSAVYGA